jgi:hypothetical protein
LHKVIISGNGVSLSWKADGIIFTGQLPTGDAAPALNMRRK